MAENPISLDFSIKIVTLDLRLHQHDFNNTIPRQLRCAVRGDAMVGGSVGS
jgi:hypothetical protein